METSNDIAPAKGVSGFGQFSGLIMAALGSALLVMLLNRSGDNQRTEQNTAALAQLTKDVEFIRQNYTPSKQTDDLREDVKELTRAVNSKLETLITQQNTLMLEMSRRK